MVSPGDDITDFELIRRMADQRVDFAEARDAWGLFYVRHHPFLLRVCSSRHGYLLGLEGVSDLVHDAFLNAFDGAGTFDHAESCEPPVQERRCRGWLASIARNLVKDRYRGQLEVCLVDDEIEGLAGTSDGDPDQLQVPENERLKLLKSGFDLLSDTEQTVLRATMFWWQADQQHQRMPQSAMQQLSEQTGKSPDAIRQIRLRALKKLEKYVNDNLQNEKAD